GDGIDAGHDVAIVATSEIHDVGLSECLALSVAAARVWTENEVAHRRCGSGETLIPVRHARRGRSSVHADYERICFAGHEVLGKRKPALHPRASVLPVNIAHCAPCGLDAAVQVGDLLPVANG